MRSFKEFLDKKTLSISNLAKKHGVSVKEIQRQIEMGKSVEKEHTTHDKVAKEIAADHVGEDPKYYDKLKKMERSN